MKFDIKESKIATLIYRKMISCSGIEARCWGIIRKIAIRILGDPCCRMDVHGRTMAMPLSHGLPIYYKYKPLYDRLPRKISTFLLRHDGFVKCIDIGANIGDTIAAFHVSEENRFLAIEPNPHFRTYLNENWSHNKNVISLSVLCSSGNSKSNFVVNEVNGTAQIVSSEQGETMEQMTVDEIIRMNPEFDDANILKIDTDGYDLRILPGAKELIKRNKPAVLFECDAFSSLSYKDDFFNCINVFREADYDNLILYDNYGNFMGSFGINGIDFDIIFSNLLGWQEDTKIIYFDILFLHRNKFGEFFKIP
jgi:FkbM family methyltransferase